MCKACKLNLAGRGSYYVQSSDSCTMANLPAGLFVKQVSHGHIQMCRVLSEVHMPYCNYSTMLVPRTSHSV